MWPMGPTRPMGPMKVYGLVHATYMLHILHICYIYATYMLHIRYIYIYIYIYIYNIYMSPTRPLLICVALLSQLCRIRVEFVCGASWLAFRLWVRRLLNTSSSLQMRGNLIRASYHPADSNCVVGDGRQHYCVDSIACLFSFLKPYVF